MRGDFVYTIDRKPALKNHPSPTGRGLDSNARQTRHLDYHWNGTDIDCYRVAGTKEVFAIRK
jgi:hypothetical protein